MKISQPHPLDVALRGIEKRSSEFIPIIVKIVSKESGISYSRMMSTTRKREVVQARQIAMLIASRVTKASLAEIGAEIGGKDHATVLHAKKTIMNLSETVLEVRTITIRSINRIWGFTTNIMVCSICGSTNIQKKGWVNPNNDKFIGWIQEEKDTNCWCEECQCHVELVSNKIFKSYDEQHRVETISDSVQKSN